MPPSFERVKAVFLAALDRAPADRAAVLDEQCAGDAALRARVEDMLRAHDQADPVLDQPVAEFRIDDAPAPAADERGTVISGRYRLREVIGEGGMGSVWLAEQTAPVRRSVALKLIKAGMDSRQVVARFEQERQALAVMDHPHIAKVLDGGTTETGRPFFVMEYVPGVPLTDFCDTERVDIAGRLALFVQVCQAVQHAHQKGVIHRDLKPSNILVRKTESGPVPKVIDFGLAKAVRQPLTEASLATGPGVLLGTLQYMSPEQAELDNPDIDTRADVYALGVILYELLTGTTPLEKQRFKKAAWLEMLRLIQQEEPPRPSDRLSNSGSLPSVAAQRSLEPVRLTRLVRGDLDWIVMKALEKDRGRRYDSATGFAADVQRYLTGDPVQAVPPSAGYRLRKFLRRNRGPVAAALLVFVVLIGGIVGTTLAMLRARDEEKKTAGERDQKEAARAAEQERRVEVEARYASQVIDLALADLDKVEPLNLTGGGPLGMDRPNPRRLMLGMTATLDRLPASARDAREYVALMILFYGQYLHSLWPTQAAAEDLAVEVAPGSDLAVCAGADNIVRVRDLFTGREVRRIRPPGTVDVAWPSRDGRTLLVGLKPAGRTRQVVLYDLATGEPAGDLVETAPWTKVWSPTGRHAFTEDAVRPPLVGDLNNPLTRASRLWDARTGRAVATYAGYRAAAADTFSPDGRLALLLPSPLTAGAWGKVVSTADGREVARVRGWAGRFTPTGRHLVMETETEYSWYRCDDWQPAGVVRRPDRRPTPPDIWGESFGTELPRPVFDAYVLHHRTLLGPQTIVCADGRSLDLAAAAAAFDDERVLTEAGTLVEVQSLQTLARPVDRRYHPDGHRLSPDGRLLQMGHLFVHLPSEQVVMPAPPPYERIEITPAPRGVVVRNFDTFGTFGVSVLPPAGIDFDPATLKLWAGVVACGELDARGQFVAWDEPTWEARRRELERAPATDGFPFPGPIASDRMHWLRQRVLDAGVALTRGPVWFGRPADAPPVLPLLDRLVAADPTWVNLTARGWERQALGDVSGSLDDWERAAGLVGATRLYGPAAGFINSFLHDPDQPKAALERFERIFAVGTNPLADPYLRLLLRYRQGRYREVVEDVARRQAAGLSGPLLAPAMAANPWAVLNQFLLDPMHQPVGPPADVVLAAMAQYQLGQTDRARAALDPFTVGQWQLPLLNEALRLTGHPKWKGKK